MYNKTMLLEHVLVQSADLNPQHTLLLSLPLVRAGFSDGANTSPQVLRVGQDWACSMSSQYRRHPPPPVPDLQPYNCMLQNFSF